MQNKNKKTKSLIIKHNRLKGSILYLIDTHKGY